MPGPTAGSAGDTSTAPAVPATPGDATSGEAAAADAPAVDASAAAGASGRAAIVVLGGLVALGPLTTDLYLPGLPAIAEDLVAEPAAVQLTLTFSMFGVAAGQLIFGPLSDRFGRRPPLLVGLVVYTLASVVCVIAPDLTVLIAARFVQGAAGAAGLVIGRAVARDRFEGVAMIRFLASITLISGLAPILAPLFGAQMLRFTSWRGTFGALAALGLLLTLVAFAALRETLPASARRGGGLSSTLRTMGGLLRNLPFLGLLLTSTFAFGALFGYISGSSVVLQHVYHVSPQTYSLLFGLNSVAIVGATQLNGRVLAPRFTAGALMRTGLAVMIAAGVSLVLVTAVWDLGLVAVCASLFVMMASLGMVLPNSAARALSLVAPQSAGSASALLGTGTFLCGAVVAPLSSLGGSPSAVLLAVVVLSCAVLSAASYLLLLRPARTAPAEAAEPAAA
ncbi:multidrug effflux MFS transporter [Kitasatospora sp. NPDC089913]|uniref:multidrug effflux MFS transporter n=1 Tax=Streptomycetaceae TaxID=2062 RepID=UPI00087BE887|nr:multidrug effflux MFS transporter [Streptomyces sp. TLI_053]SDT35811.1 MFS transporter, DHA1 family, bicyclomycin/chloramphenicol resistance protein [Streptomyces sp. TLI_053]